MHDNNPMNVTMMHNYKVVGRNHNIRGNQRIMSTTKIV